MNFKKYRRMVAERDELIAALQQKLSKKEKLVDRHKCELVAIQGSFRSMDEDVLCHSLFVLQNPPMQTCFSPSGL
jgi:hypothetical protein